MCPRNKGLEKKPETNKSKDKCGRCGYDKTHKKCPAMGQQCGLCKKMNHYAKVCRSKEVYNLRTVEDSGPEEEESEEELPLFVFSLESSSVKEDEQFYETAEREGAQLRFQLDSCAKANDMSAMVYSNLRRGSPPHPKRQAQRWFPFPITNWYLTAKLRWLRDTKIRWKTYDFSSCLGLNRCLMDTNALNLAFWRKYINSQARNLAQRRSWMISHSSSRDWDVCLALITSKMLKVLASCTKS